MSYNILTSWLGGDTETIELISNISNDKLDKPVLLSKLLDMISDDSPYIRHIGEAKTLSLARLAKEYFNTCWSAYLDTSMGGVKLDTLIKYSEYIVYHVQAPNGFRVATENEIKNGVEELVAKTTPVLSDEEAEHLNLLLWTFKGQLRYYKKAGLSFTYTDGKLDDTDYQLVCKAGQKLRGMIDWISVGGNYERALASLKIGKKASKYKYPNFAKDEIICEVSPKQIQYLCELNIVGKGLTDTQFEVKRILYRVKKDNYKPLPHEITLMRKAYNEVVNGVTENSTQKLGTTIDALCEKLDKGKATGLIDSNHFAFKIVNTIRKTGRCSDKQLNILREAENKMDSQVISVVKAQENKEKSNDIDDDMKELLELSDSLGLGKLEGE